MWPLIQIFIDIAFHRRGPEDLPSQAFLLGAVMVVALVVSTVSLVMLGNGFGTAVLETGVSLVVFLVFYRVLLTLAGRPERFTQTVTALLGTSVLLSLIAMPLLLTLGENAEEVPPLTVFLLLGLLLWSLDIAGFIISRALERHYALGVTIAVGFFLLEGQLRRWLAGD